MTKKSVQAVPEYRWTPGSSFKVAAEVARDEIERIEQEQGVCEAQELVEAARPEGAPLHPLFEWDDGEAARMYREHQARRVISAIRVVFAPGTPSQPAYVSVRGFAREEDEPRHGYISIQRVRTEQATRDAYLRDELGRVQSLLMRTLVEPEFAPLRQAAGEVEALLNQSGMAQAAD